MERKKKEEDIEDEEEQEQEEEEPKVSAFAQVLQDVKGIMKVSKKETTIDMIKEEFVKSNEAINQVTGPEIVEIYLRTFHDAFAQQAELRANYITEIMRIFECDLSGFLKGFNSAILNFTKEDSPFMKKVIALIIYRVHKEYSLELKNLVYKFDGDEFTREDQHWWYRDMLDELKKIVENDGGDQGLLNAIEASREEAKKFKA